MKKMGGQNKNDVITIHFMNNTYGVWLRKFAACDVYFSFIADTGNSNKDSNILCPPVQTSKQ